MLSRRRSPLFQRGHMVDSVAPVSDQAVPGQTRATTRSVVPVDILTVVRHPIGGIITYLKYVYPYLDRDRFRITVVAPATPQATSALAAMPGVRADLISPQGPWTLIRLFFRVTYRLATGSYAVWHSQGATAGMLMGLLSFVYRCPHVITFHETFDRNSLSGRFAPLKRRILAFLFARADVINVVTEDARINLIESFPELAAMQDRVVVIHNGVDVAYLTAPPTVADELRQRLKIPTDAHVLGYFGRFMPEKGFPVLIDAMNLLVRSDPETQYVVVAVGSGAYEREYRSRVRAFGLDARFRFLEYQSDVRWIYRQIDAIVIPSWREAFALVAAEALILGVPVVASSCIGLREVLQGSPAILVEPGNAESLANGIVRSMDSDLVLQTNNYAPSARETFDSSHTATKLAEVFSQLMGRL